MNNNIYFKDKVAIVTGASSGIGLATATLLAKYQAKVVLAARSEDKLNELSRQLSQYSEVISVKTDVSIQEECRRLIEKTIQKFGRIDILINNAGISMRAMFKDLDLSVIHRLMDVNFWGTVQCTKFALPYLLKSRGAVVGIVSIAGYTALPARTGYSASKFAIRGFLDTLRMEHLRDGLNVLVYAPGYTASQVRRNALTADGSAQGETPLDESRLMSAEAVAKRLARALYRRRSQVTLTFLGRLTIFAHRVFPRLTDRLTYRYVAREPNSPFK